MIYDYKSKQLRKTACKIIHEYKNYGNKQSMNTHNACALMKITSDYGVFFKRILFCIKVIFKTEFKILTKSSKFYFTHHE